jgi:hypothetical protein
MRLAARAERAPPPEGAHHESRHHRSRRSGRRDRDGDRSAGRVADVLLRDERAVFPVGSHNARYGMALSLPSVVGRNGAGEVLWPAMSEEETRGLERSAETLKAAVGKYVRLKRPAA